MFRLFLALNFLLLNLLACKGGYESCKLKIINSNTIKNQTLQLPVSNNQRIIYSKTPIDAKVIKHDPFLSLYLVEDSQRFRHPFKINNHLSLGVASVDAKRAIEGKIIKRQIGLNSLALFSEKIHSPALLLNSCCALEGIVTPDGIIEKEYIERFLKKGFTEYGDIGIRVEDAKKLVVVNAVNPFIKDNPFRLHDSILEFDSKKVDSSATLMQWILFSEVGSTHRVKIRRDAKSFTIKVRVGKRDGGGELSDTFLEFLGISFDKNLSIVKIEKKAQKYELKLGDTLIQINLKDITNKEDILKIISQNKNSSYLLFERDNFQFFICIH